MRVVSHSPLFHCAVILQTFLATVRLLWNFNYFLEETTHTEAVTEQDILLAVKRVARVSSINNTTATGVSGLHHQTVSSRFYRETLACTSVMRF